jgi:hypothetical protein
VLKPRDRIKHLFDELDESYKKTVKLGDGKEIYVERKGRVVDQIGMVFELISD